MQTTCSNDGKSAVGKKTKLHILSMSNLITIVTTNINDSAISLNFFYSTIDSCFSKASVTDRSTAVHVLLHLRAHAIYTNDESRS